MGDGYDRFDNEGGGGGSFVMGLLTGTVLGAGLGMLFAPKSGSDLRNQISEQAGNIANTASEGYRKATETAGEWAERGRDMYGKAVDAASRGIDEAQRYVRETASGIGVGGSTESIRGSATDQTRTTGTNPASSGPTGPSSGSRRS